MVRLRGVLLHPYLLGIFDFNSSMVRLRVRVFARLNLFFIISIPVWYDWELRQWYFKIRKNHISIPVWYDWEPELHLIEGYGLPFQFQYGTIESSSFITPIYLLVSFQFQYGTIESLASDTRTPPVNIFQFQYGTIESVNIFFVFFKYFQFQFQYGTIERKSTICFASSLSNFNSSMVRLRGRF